MGTQGPTTSQPKYILENTSYPPGPGMKISVLWHLLQHPHLPGMASERGSTGELSRQTPRIPFQSSPVSLNWFRPSPAGPSESSCQHGRRSRKDSNKLTSARKSEGRIEEIANISFQCRPPRYGHSSPFANRFRPQVPGCAVARRFRLPRVPCSRGGPA